LFVWKDNNSIPESVFPLLNQFFFYCRKIHLFKWYNFYGHFNLCLKYRFRENIYPFLKVKIEKNERKHMRRAKVTESRAFLKRKILVFKLSIKGQNFLNNNLTCYILHPYHHYQQSNH